MEEWERGCRGGGPRKGWLYTRERRKAHTPLGVVWVRGWVTRGWWNKHKALRQLFRPLSSQSIPSRIVRRPTAAGSVNVRISPLPPTVPRVLQVPGHGHLATMAPSLGHPQVRAHSHRRSVVSTSREGTHALNYGRSSLCFSTIQP